MTYKFKGDPHTYQFYLAEYGSAFGDKRIIFRVREGVDPVVRAMEKGIKYYDRLGLCTYEPFIQMWLNSHPTYQLKVKVEDLLLK